jgi:hypothetical protein
MTDVERLLREYIERLESGGSVDPTDLLDQAEGPDRARLSALIEGYLEHAAPAKGWDPEAFEGSLAERAVARLSESWSAASGRLPGKLVELRKQARIRRDDLTRQLADALGVADRSEKVAYYYHRLEWGLLPTGGVSAKVFDALAELLGTSAGELRREGETPPTAEIPGEPTPSYARIARPDPAYVEGLVAASPGDAREKRPGERDEVDRLFTEGDSG